MSRFPLRRSFLLALSIAVLGGCGGREDPATTARVGTTPPESTDADRRNARERPKLLETLRRELPAAVGNGFGCVVLPRPARSPIVVYVTPAPGAAQRARGLIRRLDGEELATVRVSSRDTADDLRQELLRRIRADAPPGIENVEIERIINRTTCPRVSIVLRPEAESPPAAESWAESMLTAFGTRRVAIERWTGLYPR